MQAPHPYERQSHQARLRLVPQDVSCARREEDRQDHRLASLTVAWRAMPVTTISRVVRAAAPMLLFVACSSSVGIRVPTVAGGPSYRSDLEACERTTPPGMDQRGERFAGCMVAAGHAAWLQVAMGEEFMVRQTTSHDRQAAADDLVQCYKTAKNERALADCLAPRGYAIQRYKP